MTSDVAASSSSQQPFASPQPAPVPASTNATSPPTKQSLKSWWKTFGKTTKNQDTHGKSSLPQYFKRPLLRHQQSIQQSIRRNATPQPSGFRKSYFIESPMSKDSQAIDGVPGQEVDHRDTAAKGLRRSFSFANSVFVVPAERLPQRRHSSLLLQKNRQAITQKRSQSMLLQSSRAPSVKRDKFGRARRSSLLINDIGNGSSDALGAGILPDQKRNPFSRLFDRMSHKSYTEFIEPVEQAPGIFGVPLRQSITYANVAISLVDGEGKSYIYGYVPIVVAKCGVYLKEKGALFSTRQELAS
jgi:hypothetical protein